MKENKERKETPSFLPTRPYTVCSEVVGMVGTQESRDQPDVSRVLISAEPMTPESRTVTQRPPREKEME